ncbi:ketosynthase chain-length factor [Amycolatopsis minnesotensis]|uniref:Ketosynthase chain-length factor n=1 Tax=Amycolatopsis minnesotensis TaxID=337894 RepID=A0ABN2RMD0_9PSEU
MTAPVVTGIGVVAPNGVGVADYWAATLRGESGIARITRFDPAGYSAQLAGQVDVDAAAALPSRLLPQTDHMTRLALLAADEALADAGAELGDGFRAGVVTAASGGGFEFGQRELENLWRRGGAYVSAYQSFAWFYPVNTGQISIRHNLRGPGATVVAEQAGGLDALAKARGQLAGGAELMLAGGVDGSLCPWGWLCQISSGRISTASEPGRAYLPFDEDATGFVPGEGGALLALEDAEVARRRGVGDGYGRITGYAATFDPRPGSGREPGLRRAVELALARAGTRPSEVDVVFADASGNPAADRVEAHMLAEAFGPRGVPVAAPKTMTGRLLGGGAALDVAAALLSLRHSVVPPAVHIGRPKYSDEIDLVVGEPRERPLSTALVVARGHGGFNSALVVTK